MNGSEADYADARPCAGQGALLPYLEDRQAQMFIELVRRQVEQGRQGNRASLARSDQTVEIFRHNKAELRMQLLKESVQDRRQMLRAAIVVRKLSSLTAASLQSSRVAGPLQAGHDPGTAYRLC